MKQIVAALALAALAGSPLGASAAEPPYQRLADDFGTPNLVDSHGPSDHSQMVLHFARRGESYARWTKMTSVSIVRVDAGDTDAALKTIADKLHATLVAEKATALDFQTNAKNASFTFTAPGEHDRGIVYSPRPGYVTVVQVASKDSQPASADDDKIFKDVLRS